MPQLVADRFRTGLDVLTALRANFSLAHRDFSTSRQARRQYHAAAQWLLAPIRDHRLALKKAPDIGWFPEMYPDTPALLLPFPVVQGLNSSWQWYLRGVALPVLSRPLHPLHGTYFPTRHEHLFLFQEWLQQTPPRTHAVDVGTGCGVLALMLAETGWPHVRATDINPNAIEGLRRDLVDTPEDTIITPMQTALTGPLDVRFDLIVFNPPWLPGETHSLLDQAIYYPPDLFDEFFAAAWRSLAPDGRVVMLFSDLLIKSGQSRHHPIARELKRRKRFVQVDRRQRAVSAGSKRSRRRQRHLSAENVQLWVLKRR